MSDLMLNEDEYGFRRAKRPIYYDEGLEVTIIHYYLEHEVILFLLFKL